MKPMLCLGLLLEVQALSHWSGTWQVCFGEYEESRRKEMPQLTACHMIFCPKELPLAVNTDCYRACNRVGVGTLQSWAQVYWRWDTGGFAFSRKEVCGRKASVWCIVVVPCTAPQIFLENTSLTALCIFFPQEGYDWSHAPGFLTNKP